MILKNWKNCLTYSNTSRFFAVMSGNNGKRRKLNTCCNVVKYPSPADKSATSPAGGEVLKHALLSQCAPDATGFLSDVYKRSTRAQKFLADGVQGGRSMIEMLGVLAIIAVLSVGGIAGYSKAMEKYKINKVVNEYSYLIAGLMERLPEIQNMTPPYTINPADKKIGLVDYVQAAGLVPPSWKKVNTLNMYDSINNYVYIGSRWNRLYIDLALGGVIKQSSGSTATSNFSGKLCMELIQTLVYPLHSSLHHFTLYKTSGKGYTHSYYGDAYCANNQETQTYIQKCLSVTPLTELNSLCQSCDKTNYQKCYFTIEF